MIAELQRGDSVFWPSKMWKGLGENHLERLEKGDDFKRTLALQYFTWIPKPFDSQWRFVLLHTLPIDHLRVLRHLSWRGVGLQLNRRQALSLVAFTRLLWIYATRHDPEGLLVELSEPKVGNPFDIRLNGQLISQDLANSVLEYNSIREEFKPRPGMTICELGAGYGRLAYVFISATPCRYVVVDIPPALYVSQQYLCAVFPGKKIFRFRPFDSFDEVRAEFESSDIAFLLPHQAELLPPKSIDLFLNVSSLHEMTKRQVEVYFDLIDRLTRGLFYSKQFREGRNEEEEEGTLSARDYPVPPHWRQVYFRTPKVQTEFFEALYEVR